MTRCGVTLSTMFDRVEPAPADPILGLTEAFRADDNPNKVNLGVGVFRDDTGVTPALECTKRAEARLLERAAERSYLPITGSPAYGEAVRKLLLRPTHAAIGRTVTAHSPGGTGGLRVAADLIHALQPGTTIWFSTPTWANHPKIFGAAGLECRNYKYYNKAKHGVDFEAMKSDLSAAGPKDVVVFHASCHNPTGFDPSSDQWRELAELRAERGFGVLFDAAYQGLGDGFDEDAAAIRLFAEHDAPMFIASSFSKNFSLYNERVGAISFVGKDRTHADNVFGHLKRSIRHNYSNPPRHGGAVVIEVLGDAELTRLWKSEVSEMRSHLHELRGGLVAALRSSGASRDFSFIGDQKGMFSFTGLTADEVQRLREEFSIYIVNSGRINVAGLNSKNMSYVVSSIKTVVG